MCKFERRLRGDREAQSTHLPRERKHRDRERGDRRERKHRDRERGDRRERNGETHREPAGRRQSGSASDGSTA
jgi:hypothetical protein